MAVFAVVLDEPHEEVEALIKKAYPECYRMNPTFFLVESKGIAQTVAEAVRIKGDDRVPNSTGVVIHLQSYSYAGHSSRALWDWFKKAEESK